MFQYIPDAPGAADGSVGSRSNAVCPDPTRSRGRQSAVTHSVSGRRTVSCCLPVEFKQVGDRLEFTAVQIHKAALKTILDELPADTSYVYLIIDKDSQGSIRAIHSTMSNSGRSAMDENVRESRCEDKWKVGTPSRSHTRYSA